MTTNFPATAAFTVTLKQLDDLHVLLGRTTVINGDKMTADIFDGEHFMYRVALV